MEDFSLGQIPRTPIKKTQCVNPKDCHLSLSTLPSLPDGGLPLSHLSNHSEHRYYTKKYYYYNRHAHEMHSAWYTYIR